MKFHVIFSPEADDQVFALYNYIADADSPNIAKNYIDTIISYCESLSTFPVRGIKRDDVRPGLRITNYKSSTVIAFDVDMDTKIISIVGIFYGGQDYQAILQDKEKLYPGEK